jgi:hypothetical protein
MDAAPGSFAAILDALRQRAAEVDHTVYHMRRSAGDWRDHLY